MASSSGAGSDEEIRLDPEQRTEDLVYGLGGGDLDDILGSLAEAARGPVGPAVAEQLWSLTEHELPIVSAGAARALGAIGDAGVQRAARLLEHAAPHVREAAAALLAGSATPRALAALRARLGVEPDGAAREYMRVRMEEAARSERPELPAQARERLVERLQEVVEHLEGPIMACEAIYVEIYDVRGDATRGYEYAYKSGSQRGIGYAIPYAGTWVVSPTRLDAGELDAMSEAVRRYLIDEIAPNAYEGTPDEIFALCQRARPVCAHWPGGRPDEHDLAANCPILIDFEDPFGDTSHVRCGYNPKTKEIDVDYT